MPNANIPKGAEPAGRPYQLNSYVAASTIMPGDFVSQDATGTVAPAVASAAIKGVAMGYATVGQEVLVADHPDQLFVVQSSGTAPAAQTDIGLNYDILPGTANATYKRSSMQLAGTTGATTATLPLKLISVDRAVDNALGTNAKCVVRINNHQNGSSTGSAGV